MNPGYTESNIPLVKATPWNRIFRSKSTTPEFIDFISLLLQYDPKARPDPLEILGHPFFDELRE